MPMFSNIRDSRGRFVGHGVANDLENALTDALTNINPSSWKRFWTLTEQRLGMNPWDFLRQHGGRIPVGALTAGGGAPPPPGGTGGFRPVMQGSAQMVTFHKDIHTMSHDIHQLLGLQQRAFQGGIGVHAAAAAYGGLPFRHGMLGPQTIMNWPGTLMTQGGPGPLLRALGGMGTGGGGAGFGGGGGRGGGFGRGFGGGALAGLLPPGLRRLAGEAGEGFIGYETIKFLMNPIAFASNAIIQPLASSSRRAWDFRRSMFGAAGPGGSPQALSDLIAPGLAPSLGIARDAMPPAWMMQLGMGPEDARDLMAQYGIRGRSLGENVRNLQMLGVAREGLTDRFQGFRGMDPASIVGMARTGMARGVGGTGELANTSFLDQLSDAMTIAVAEGADRASIFGRMEEALQMLSRAGASGINFGPLSKLFEQMALSGLPGGRTGEAALSMTAGELGAIRTIGVDPKRSLVAAGLFGKYGGDFERMLGPDIMKNLTPVQAQALGQAKDLAKQGAILPAFQLLSGILEANPERWRELSMEGAGMFMPGMPGMQTLFGAGVAGVRPMEQLGAGMGARVGGATVRGGMAEKMWGWLKSHGYTDEAAAAVIANATQESGLDPSNVSKRGELGLFQFNPKGELPGYLTWARANGKDPNDWESQMEYTDMRTGQLLPGFKTSIGVNLPGVFEQGFERPASLSDMGMRNSLGRSIQSTFAGAGGALGGFDIGNDFSPRGGGLAAQFGNLVPGVPTHTFEGMAASQAAGLTASAGWADTTNVKAFTDEVGKASGAVEQFATMLGAAIRAGQQALGIQPAPVVTPQTTGP